MGLFHDRVIDLQSSHATEMRKGKVVGGHAVPFNGKIIRELAYTQQDKHTLQVHVRAVGETKAHTIMLHRFVSIVAANHGMSVVKDGAIASLGLEIPADSDGISNYDRHFEYHTDTVTLDSIMRALRVGDRHSTGCDWDHNGGRDHRHLHGLLYGLETSHRLNICYRFVRENAGHWCNGLQIMEYTNGQVSHDVTLSTVLDDMKFPTSGEVEKGTLYVANDLA